MQEDDIILSDSSECSGSDSEPAPTPKPKKLVRKPTIVAKPSKKVVVKTKKSLGKGRNLAVEEPVVEEAEVEPEEQEVASDEASPAEKPASKAKSAKRTKAQLDELEKRPFAELSAEDQKAVKRRIAARNAKARKAGAVVQKEDSQPEPVSQPEPEPEPEKVEVAPEPEQKKAPPKGVIRRRRA